MKSQKGIFFSLNLQHSVAKFSLGFVFTRVTEQNGEVCELIHWLTDSSLQKKLGFCTLQYSYEDIGHFRHKVSFGVKIYVSSKGTEIIKKLSMNKYRAVFHMH